MTILYTLLVLLVAVLVTTITSAYDLTMYVYVYFIGKSVNILYSTTQNYILYNIPQDETHQARTGLLACCCEPLS